MISPRTGKVGLTGFTFWALLVLTKALLLSASVVLHPHSCTIFVMLVRWAMAPYPTSQILRAKSVYLLPSEKPNWHIEVYDHPQNGATSEVYDHPQNGACCYGLCRTSGLDAQKSVAVVIIRFKLLVRQHDCRTIHRPTKPEDLKPMYPVYSLSVQGGAMEAYCLCLLGGFC